jgi:hypothetical protein
MHMTKSKKKSYRIFIQQKFKICFSMHFGFNNEFIKVMSTRPTFQKFQKKYFIFFLISGITKLHIRCTPNIKISFFG